jgi:uncharacterized protein YndB with AHSA1/START domain
MDARRSVLPCVVEPEAETAPAEIAGFSREHPFLSMRQMFGASQEAVFGACSGSDSFLQWFGAPGYPIRSRVDARQGGPFHIVTAGADELTHTITGSFTELLPPRRIALSWQWKSLNGPTIEQVHAGLATIDLLQGDAMCHMLVEVYCARYRVGDRHTSCCEEMWTASLERLALRVVEPSRHSVTPP